MTRSQPPRAVRRLVTLVLLLAATTCLTGCDEFAEKLALLIFVVLAIMAVTYGTLLAVLIVNIVKLLRGRPSLGWGVTSVVCGGLTGLPALSHFVSRLASDPQLAGLSLASLGLSGALVYFGLRNMQGAKASATFSSQSPTIEPPPEPPPPPPGTRAPPWP